MFGFISGMMGHPSYNPQQYRGDLRTPSPDPPIHGYPSHHDSRRYHHHHHHRPHHAAVIEPTEAAGGAAATETAATAVVPLQRSEVVLPMRRVSRRPPSTATANSQTRPPAPSQSSTPRDDTGTDASPDSQLLQEQGLARTSFPAPGVPTTGGPPAEAAQQGDNYEHYRQHHRRRHPRRARSSEVGLRDRRVNSVGGISHTTHSHNPNLLSEAVATGLRGFRTYMRMMFQSGNHGGLNVHPTPYEVDSSNSTYRVPESPPPPPQRTTSELVAGRERSRRVQAQMTGIPLPEQHNLLRRLRFTRSAFPQETESVISEEQASACTSTTTPLSTRTPLSVFMPHGGEAGCTLESWVVSLDPADPSDVPFPAISKSCSVCLRRFCDEEDVAELPCGHLYHFTCIIRWLMRQGSCPCCRADVRELDMPTRANQEEVLVPRMDGAAGEQRREQ